MGRKYAVGFMIAVSLMSASVTAQVCGGKPVSLLVPYPAGGLSDVIARKVQPALQQALGQPVIVENLAGASGGIAAQKALNAPSDGCIVFQGSPNELILAPMALAAIKYKAEDFKQVQRIASAQIAIFARNTLAANSADELIALAKRSAAEGNPLSYASVGPGTFYHLLGEELSKRAGAKMIHVPYKGGAPARQDLLGGQVDLYIAVYGQTEVQLIKEGKIKALAAAAAQRQSLLPEVPSVEESQSLKGFHFAIGTGYYVKPDTPAPVINALHTAISKVLSDSEVRAFLMGQGLLMSPALTLDAAAKAHADETTQFRAIGKAANIQPQ